MQIITTHKGTDFDAAASVLAAKILYPEAIAVLPKSLNPNVRSFLSIHKDLFDVQTPEGIELEAVMSLIIVDTNRWDRLDQMDRLKEKENLEIILWDHHLNGERWRYGETISTAFVESTVNQVVSKRMVKKQQMRWSQRGAHLLLQVRTRVLNDELREAFRQWYPNFDQGDEDQKLAA